MKNSLYEYFDCSNREELYKKIKDEKEEVKEFIEYLNYAKNNLENENLKFRCRNDVRDYLNSSHPRKNEVQILMLDSNSNLLSDNKFDINSSFKDILKTSYVEKAKLVILVYHDIENNKDKVLKLAEDLKEITGYKILDKIRIDNMKMFSEYGDIGEIKKEIDDNNISKKDFMIKKYEKITSSEKYNEFMIHYAEKELLGLNVITDENKIKELLKTSLQEDKQENFGILQYDDKYKISKVDILFKGGVEKALVDTKVVIPYLLNDEIKGIEVFHNHPSGNITPSSDDIETTETLGNLTKKLDKELLDHYIVAKEGIFSFKDEWLIENHSSKALEEIVRQEKEKINQYNKAGEKESKVPGKKNPWIKTRSRSREQENER